MSILTPSEVATFLGIPDDTEGLPEAIEVAEDLVAGKLNLPSLSLADYSENRLMGYTSQQFITRAAPVRVIDSFVYDDDDVTSEVEVGPGGFGIQWSDPDWRDFDRVTSFDRKKRVEVEYSAGWTNSDGLYPLPSQIKAYAMAMAGITLNNLLASGVYDTKLGDMTIKIQRETLEKNLEVFDKAIARYARP